MENLLGSSLAGKRLLVLGGSKNMEVIVNKARELGIYSIVTDIYPVEKSPAKLLADKYCNINFSHYDEIKELVQSEKIDGVITGFSDNDMHKYLRICEDNNLPCYLDEHTLGIATDKNKFKSACIRSGVPVIPGIAAKNIGEIERFAAKIGYPLMIKPSDNSGSRGVIKCPSPSELKQCYEYALSYSANKIIIAEKYLDCDNIAVSYFAADGEIRLSSTDDRKMYVSKETGSSISCYSVYPSSYTERYINEVNDTVIKMLKENGFRNGMIMLQAFVDDKSFYFCEMCYRLSGGQHHIKVKRFNDIDQLALLLRYAVSGSCRNEWEADRETPFFSQNCAMLRILGVPGRKIAKIDGIDAVSSKSNVIKAYLAKKIGDTIGQDGTTTQIIGNIVYSFSKTEVPEEAAQKLFDCLSITDENGDNMAWFTLGSKKN